ncbi:MAG TPA: hypothetical protein DCY85_12650, partial [Firmicutes bacterium]|nr:hypothetical protein [Bacillota bacterium]
DQLDTAFGTAVWTMINVMRSFAAMQGIPQGTMPANPSVAGTGPSAPGATTNINPAALDIQSIDITQVYK